jgi:hypothetical protein
MKLRGAALAVLACVTFVPSSPAHAADATVASDMRPAFTQWMQDGSDTVLAGAVCHAVGTGGSPTQVAVATQVHCSINGTERSASVPGSAAATTIIVAAVPPVVMCHGGSAIFLETAGGANVLTYVDVPDTCVVFPV